MTPHGQKLPASHLQLLIDSVTPGADLSKGTQQFFTRPEYAAALATALPPPRLAGYGDTHWQMADLTGCGGGSLLLGAARHYGVSSVLYGADIDPRARGAIRSASGGTVSWANIAHADITRLYPLLAEVKWRCPLILSNPPFSLRWPTERLRDALGASEVYRVRDTWEQGHYDRADAIDSTLASYLISLDRLTPDGEGYLICLWSTYERLIAETPAAEHLWLALRLVRGGHLFDPPTADYDVAVLYFARDHRLGRPHLIEPGHGTGFTPESITAALQHVRRHRSGIVAGADYAAKDVSSRWTAATGEYRQRHDPDARPDYNLRLHPGGNGRIATFLTPFQQVSGHLPASAVMALRSLDGQTPMGLTVQRATRQALLDAVHNPLWTVQPELVAAVQQAVADYQAQRSPLYPLPPVQRLGYLDEEDAMQCRRDLGPFRSGQRYRIETRTESAEFKTEILDATGQTNLVRRTGRELVLEMYPGAEGGTDLPHVFILGGKYQYETASHTPEDRLHTFADLVDHFTIPEVPDIAAVRPDDYQAHLATIGDIEAAIRLRLQ